MKLQKLTKKNVIRGCKLLWAHVIDELTQNDELDAGYGEMVVLVADYKKSWAGWESNGGEWPDCGADCLFCEYGNYREQCNEIERGTCNHCPYMKYFGYSCAKDGIDYELNPVEFYENVVRLADAEGVE